MAQSNLRPSDLHLLEFTLKKLTESRKLILRFLTALFVLESRHGHYAPKKQASLATASILVCLGFSLLHAEPRKTEKEPPVEPSVGYDATLEVHRGETKPITLRAIPSDGYDVEFKILTQPRFGTLSDIVRNSKGSVTILYTQHGEKNHPADSFKFKIKTGPKKCWSTKTARIQITEPPAHMEISTEILDFGHVFIGESATLPVQIRNSGGGILHGRIIAASPWSITGSPHFALTSGKSKTLAITFAPENPDTQLGKITFETGTKPPVEIPIQGVGEHRFDAPDKAAFDPSIKPYSLQIKIANKTSEPLPIKIHADLPLETPDQISLSPSETSEIELKIKPGFFADKSASLLITDGIGERSLKVQLPPPPPVLAWEPPKLDLGDITKGTKISLDLTLHNRGTTSASVKLIAEGDGISIPKPSIDIEPGQSLAIPAEWTPSGTGPASATIHTNSSNLPSLTFRANLQNPRIPPPVFKSASTPAPSPTATKNTNADPVHVLSKEEIAERKKGAPADISYRLEQRWTSVDVIISWKYNGPQPAMFSIEVEKLRRNDALSKPFEDRLKLPDELPAKKDTLTWCAVPAPIANIHQLPDGSWQGTAPGFKQGLHQIRIATHPPTSKKIHFSAFVINIPTLPSIWMNKWLHGSLFLLSAAYLFLRPLLRLFKNKN